MCGRRGGLARRQAEDGAVTGALPEIHIPTLADTILAAVSMTPHAEAAKDLSGSQDGHPVADQSSAIHVRTATRADVSGIVVVSSTSTTPEEEVGFGALGRDSPFLDADRLRAAWQDPNLVRGEELLVAVWKDRIVGCATIQDRGEALELINIDALRELQGQGIGTTMVRYVEERARTEGKRAVTLGTSRNAQGVPWKSLPWWLHLGYQVTHEEENAWTRAIGPGVTEIRMRKELL